MDESTYAAMVRQEVVARIKREVRGSQYRYTARPIMAHADHAEAIEESYGDTYCCHRCSVIGVR